MLEEALHDQSVMNLEFFNQASLKAFAKEHFDGRRDRSDLLWRFLFFVRWYNYAMGDCCPDKSGLVSTVG